MTMLIVLIIAGVAVALFAYGSHVCSQRIRAKNDAELRATAKWLSSLAQQGARLKVICADPPNVILETGEEILGVFPQTTLLEPRSIRTSRGAYAGPSFRVFKGMSFRFGGYGGTSESHDEVRPVDRGSLLLTSQRLVFVGAGRTASVPLEKIIDVEGYDDGLKLHREGKQRVEYFQFGRNISMPYEQDGTILNANLNGQVVKIVIEQAIQYRAHPELVGRRLSSLDAPQSNAEVHKVSLHFSGDAQPVSAAADKLDATECGPLGNAADSAAAISNKSIILKSVEYLPHSAYANSKCADNVEYIGIIPRKSDGIHCLSFRHAGSSRAYNVELGLVRAVQVDGPVWRSSSTTGAWRECAAQLRSFIEKRNITAADFK